MPQRSSVDSIPADMLTSFTADNWADFLGTPADKRPQHVSEARERLSRACASMGLSTKHLKLLRQFMRARDAGAHRKTTLARVEAIITSLSEKAVQANDTSAHALVAALRLAADICEREALLPATDVALESVWDD
eukprot:m51a1_g2993 hypothetical protein (135) ;mRNA; r:752459-752863